MPHSITTIRVASFALFFVIVASIFAINFHQQVFSIFNGRPSADHPSTGYAILALDDGSVGACGLNYVSPNAGITAAHCLEGVTEVYPGTGPFSEDFQSKAPAIESFNYSPEYNEQAFAEFPGLADVGVVRFADPVQVNAYGSITSPSEGCNYELVGYGLDENDQFLNRNGISACIKNITEYSFEVTFPSGSGFCQGDSGSAIYETGTNNMVGLVSLYITEIGKERCQDALAYVATRLDDNRGYLEANISENIFAGERATGDETVPNDYYEEYYPEAMNDDGTFNYNNEYILEEIERLSDLFEGIYPDEPSEGTGDDAGIDENVTEDGDLVSEPDWWEMGEGDDSGLSISTEGSPLMLLICGVCCGGGLLVLIIVFLAIRKSKRSKKTIAEDKNFSSTLPSDQHSAPPTTPSQVMPQVVNTSPAVIPPTPTVQPVPSSVPLVSEATGLPQQGNSFPTVGNSMSSSNTTSVSNTTSNTTGSDTQDSGNNPIPTVPQGV